MPKRVSKKSFNKAGTRATFEIDDRKLQEIIKKVGNAKITPRIIADGVEYGVYVEFGYHAQGGGGGAGRKGRKKRKKGEKRNAPKFGSTVPARPFLRPAYERVVRDLPDAIGQAVELAIDPNDIIIKAANDILANAMVNVPIDTGALHDSLHVEPPT